jgi:N-hydroxyarylamine O-acetyltransferase
MHSLPSWAERYLQALRLDQEQPSFDFLKKIIVHHLSVFPFENVSKLLYYRDRSKNGFMIPDMNTFIEHHERFHFGGTCYTLNSNLLRLLQALGFQTRYMLLGGEHMAILVQLEEFPDESIYVDCGGAAPLFDPVRFETLKNPVSRFGKDVVSITPVAGREGMYVYERFTAGKKRGKAWQFDLNKHYEWADFQPCIEKANLPGTTFMSMLRCQIWQLNERRSVSLADNEFSIRYANGNVQKTKLTSVTDVEEVLVTQFRLPRLPVREAVAVLQALGVHIFDLSGRNRVS